MAEDNDDTLDPFIQAVRDLRDQFEHTTALLKTHRARWAADRAERQERAAPPIERRDRKPGDTWKVRVGAQVFDSVIDPKGVARFRQNKVIWDLFQAARQGFRLDMNAIVCRMHDGYYTVEDVRELDALIGYSHDGFLELSYNSYPEESGLKAEPVDIIDV